MPLAPCAPTEALRKRRNACNGFGAAAGSWSGAWRKGPGIPLARCGQSPTPPAGPPTASHELGKAEEPVTEGDSFSIGVGAAKLLWIRDLGGP